MCGTSAMENKIIVVNDVSKYPNYISCDNKTKSEIVVPIFEKKKLTAVLDIDSIAENDFGMIDKINLEKICRLISD